MKHSLSQQTGMKHSLSQRSSSKELIQIQAGHSRLDQVPKGGDPVLELPGDGVLPRRGPLLDDAEDSGGLERSQLQQHLHAGILHLWVFWRHSRQGS